nr:DUF4180 domain-containing protein [uncultured Brevundimonas sp.]
METTVEIWGGERVMVCAEDGPLLADERDIDGFVGEALGHDAKWLALPVSRLGGDFLKLRTRLAGETTQKFVNYRIGLAVIGDISDAVAASDALRDYVRECNRGRQVWFLPDLPALRAALGA